MSGQGKSASRKPGGIVILAGTHSSIALARGVRHLGMPVWFVTNDSPLPRFSRHIQRTLVWDGAGDPGAAAFLVDAAREHGLEGWLLVAAGDPEVHLVSQQHDVLAKIFTMTVPPWERLQWACEKSMAYRRAIDLGIGVPEIYNVASVAEAAKLDPQFPIVLKPSTRVDRNPFTLAKAWRIDDPEEFLPQYERAVTYVGAENVVVQEMVPGGGECQFSYAALWDNGKPVVEFTARRIRQFPIEFGFTSTCVEVVDAPDVMTAGRAFSNSIQHHGLIEVEFKRDLRTGRLKLLDVNPRPWSWFGLAEAAGVPFAPMMVALASGETPPAVAGPRLGATWMYLPRDIVSAMMLMIRGMLSPKDYFGSFGRVRAWATFAWDDPLPALVDAPLALSRVVTKRLVTRIKSGSGRSDTAKA